NGRPGKVTSAAMPSGGRRSHSSMALGPHSQRELTPMPRRGCPCPLLRHGRRRAFSYVIRRDVNGGLLKSPGRQTILRGAERKVARRAVVTLRTLLEAGRR